jgi:hypothetical protein
MNPVVLLQETMKAAGDARLRDWHEALKIMGKQSNDAEAVSAIIAIADIRFWRRQWTTGTSCRPKLMLSLRMLLPLTLEEAKK